MRRSGRTDFWALTSTTKHLPRETREYVPLVLAAMIIARNPGQYGMTVAAAEPVEYEKVEVPRGVDLRRVAEWAGTTIDEIQTLNPELRRWTTPVKYEYEIKVPVGSGDRLKAELESAPKAELTALKWHTVKRGESIKSIARKLGVSRTDLAEANGLSVKARVRTGQQLIIPRAPATLLAARTDRQPPASLAVSRSIAGTADAPDARPASSRVIHRVRRGDTLFGIARLYDTTVEKIKTWNRLRSNRISAGDRLTIFATKTR
jgi:membrane-bound lytic murein transglycosylase D